MTHDIQSFIELTRRSEITHFRATGAGSPLFCFPGAGGDDSIFRPIVAALPEGQPVYVIDMKSLCDVKEAFTIQLLAPLYLDVVRKIQAKGPYYFCGYSFGGLLAYEMAMRLLDEGDSAELVALLDAANPAMLQNLSEGDAAQFHKTYLTDRLKKYRDQLLRGDIKEFTKRALAFILPRIGRIFIPTIKAGYRITKTSLPRLLRSNDPGFLNAWKAYVPKRYEKSIVVFRVQDRGPEYDSDLTMGWDTCVAGGVHVHTVPGTHVEMMLSPTSVRVIAETLATYLDDGSNQEKL